MFARVLRLAKRPKIPDDQKRLICQARFRPILYQQILLSSKINTPFMYNSRILLKIHSVRAYSEEAKPQRPGLSHEEVTHRVIEVVKSFNKVDPAAVTPQAHFTKDLGLDSLDNVELVLCIEDEFAIVIPDEESDKIVSVQDAIEYIVANPHAK